MIKYFSSLVLFIGIVFQSYCQSVEIENNVSIDPAIKKEVEAHISPLSENDSDTLGLIYYSHIISDIIEGDSVISSTKDSLINGPFKAFYQVRNDSLFLVGEFGLTSGFRFGFVAAAKNEKASVTHFFCDEMPAFKHHINDSLQYCINVACPEAKLVLNEFPDSESKEPVLGYVTFETEEFYSKESTGLRKTRSRMKVYFFARNIPVEK